MRPARVPTVVADPENAIVVFVQPINGAEMGVVAENGDILGDIPTGSMLIAKVPPGSHTFYKLLFRKPSIGDYSIRWPLFCGELSGTFLAAKLYFVELTGTRLLIVGRDHPHLREWSVGPQVERALPGSVTGDPDWAACRAHARQEAAKQQAVLDFRSTIQGGDALDEWP